MYCQGSLKPRSTKAQSIDLPRGAFAVRACSLSPFPPQIEWGACALVLTGNTVIFATILGFFLVFGSNDDFSWQQW